MTITASVWVFNGAGGRFPSAVFSSREIATRWISMNRLTGLLTEYPVDRSVYDWAVVSGFYQPKPGEDSRNRMQGFTSATQQHLHFENGVEGG